MDLELLFRRIVYGMRFAAAMIDKLKIVWQNPRTIACIYQHIDNETQLKLN